MLKKLSKPIAIAIAMATALALSSCVGGGVSEDQVKQEILHASLMEKGFVNSDYVENALYELTDFKVTNQTIDGSNRDHSLIEVEGTISNGSLESTFVAVANYYKQGEAWIQSDSQLVSVNTIPLKGVDFISKPTEKDAFTVSDFQSTFEESNGSYTSTATQNVTYEFWFATDTANNTQTFTFDQAKGWVANGETEVSDLKTTWNLEGKTLKLTDWSGDPDGNVESSITFIASDEGTLKSDYSINFVNDETVLGDNWTHYDYFVTGQLIGVPAKEFGKDGFSVDLNDSENAVTLKCRTASNGTVAGYGTVNTIRAEVITEKIYLASNRFDFKYPFEIEAYYSELL